MTPADARALSESRRWGEAGEAWDAVARAAQQRGDGGASVEAWGAAGECWRRADRPARAKQSLGFALGLPQPFAHRAQLVARLAAVLGELGEGQEAARLLQGALAPAEGPVRAALLDTLIGNRMGFGRLAEVRPLLAQLEALTAAGLAVAFRQGQVARLDGALGAAEACFRGVVDALGGVEGAEAGVAAAEMELAEVAVLRGHPVEALEPFERGRELHLAAGRRALAYRCEAGRVRASVEAGLVVACPLLEEGLALAVDRGMELLALDLGLARGMARAAHDAEGARHDLRRALRSADAMGARMRGGRARLQLVERGLVREEEGRGLLREAEALLADHRLLARRAAARAAE